MCGILGVVAPAGRTPSVSDDQAVRLRDLMTHRGPDGAGLHRDASALLAHRRLAIRDLTHAGAQPMSTPDGRFTLVYNGELYNEPQMRAQLAAASVKIRSTGDTETVLQALATWGPAALDRFRGMYALALLDTREQTLLLAVDELAIKPLHWTMPTVRGGPELVFASEIEPVLRHPAMSPQPDPVVVSSYLTTIRTTLGDRTLFAGVRTLTPGQRLLFNLRSPDLQRKSWHAPAVAEIAPPADAADALRQALDASVRAHLRSDASICLLLSGGLDSAAIAHCAAAAGLQLDTYCSGAPATAPTPAAGADHSPADDFHHARAYAAHLGARHTEAPVSRTLFSTRWRHLIARSGQPLSTPNEIAINEVARTLRAHGHAATLSGEGADELLAGYTEPLRLAATYFAASAAANGAAATLDPGGFQLTSCSWIPVGLKSDILTPDTWRAAERDETLTAHYREQWSLAAAEPGAADPLEVTLRFHRRINLTGLLRRLDSATMLASVESRTPFADRDIASLCAAIPITGKYRHHPAHPETKTTLRRAMTGHLPQSILARPKASFPLPFIEWLDDAAGILHHPGAAADLLRPDALAHIATSPACHWQRAWPTINIALWAQRWWG